jgi:hypothetical protein
VTRGHAVDRFVDLDAVLDHSGDQLAGEFGGSWIAFRLGQMTLEDGLRGALPEVRLEDRGERESAPNGTAAVPAAVRAAGPSARARVVSLRRHRR